VDIDEFVAAFNLAVSSGQWDPYLRSFTGSATLEFVGPPVGPFHGLGAIRAAYEGSPPDDTIELIGSEEQAGGELVSRYRWQRSGATGTMRRRLTSDRRVEALVITFD
jgi:hypothetical protein